MTVRPITWSVCRAAAALPGHRAAGLLDNAIEMRKPAPAIAAPFLS